MGRRNFSTLAWLSLAVLCCSARAQTTSQPVVGSVNYQESFYPDNTNCPGYVQSNFRQIGPQGFGDAGNSYVWGMAQFKGKIYVGSNRWFLCLIKQEIGNNNGTAPNEFPLACPANLLPLDLRARIFCFDPKTNKIEMVYMSPTFQVLQTDGTIVNAPRDYGYRTMLSFTETDGTQALYVGTFISRQYPSKPARILRTVDGHHFDEIATPYSNNNGFTAFRQMTLYKNRLYVCNIGSDQSSSVAIEAAHPEKGEFRTINPPFFGDPTNDTPYALGVHNGYLYVGVANPVKGFYLYKTQCDGDPPYSFKPVLVNGAYRGKLNETVMSLTSFNGQLYLGSGILFGGYDVLRNVGPAPAEMLRVRSDDSWDLICGSSRNTPDGFKQPLTGIGPGFGNPWTGYMWRQVVHNGVLYLGTFDSSYIAQYMFDVTLGSMLESIQAADPELKIDPALYPGLNNVSLDEYFDVISAQEGGFDLYETVDGENWMQCSRTGFSDLFNYGVRNFVSTDYGLYLGTANPFYGFKLYLAQKAGTDSDGDGIPDVSDNCPFTFNPDQTDNNHNGIGDACDNDHDSDGFVDTYIEPGDVITDQIPGNPQPDYDTDKDGIPDRMDPDIDNDGIPNDQDNCPYVYNFDQKDSVGDGVGDACRGATPQPGPPSGLPIAGDLKQHYINATTQPAQAFPEPQLQNRPTGSAGNGNANGGASAEPGPFDPNKSDNAPGANPLSALGVNCPGASLSVFGLTALMLVGLQTTLRRR